RLGPPDVPVDRLAGRGRDRLPHADGEGQASQLQLRSLLVRLERLDRDGGHGGDLPGFAVLRRLGSSGADAAIRPLGWLWRSLSGSSRRSNRTPRGRCPHLSDVTGHVDAAPGDRNRPAVWWGAGGLRGRRPPGGGEPGAAVAPAGVDGVVR